MTEELRPPGLVYLADQDVLVLKLFEGDEPPEETEVWRSGPDDGVGVGVVVGSSGRVLAVEVHDARRWVPAELRQASGVGDLHVHPVADRPDAVALALFPGALDVGRDLEQVAYAGGTGSLALLHARSGRVVAVLVDEASRRLPPEFLPG